MRWRITNVLNMLDLAGIPLHAAERTGPVAAGRGRRHLHATTPEPMADFIDLLILGEGEDVTLEHDRPVPHGPARRAGARQELLRSTPPRLPGVYVPSLYEVTYHQDGTVAGHHPEGRRTGQA